MDSLNKNDIRRQAIARRQALSDDGQRSSTTCSRVVSECPIHKDSHWLVYVSVRDEVKTTHLVEEVLAICGEVVVPYCLTDAELGLFRLSDLKQLERGAFGILEPIRALREERTISPEILDTVVMPGVAFDRRGNRIGYGKGYFDRLLERLRSDCRKIGLAFDCQIFPEIPTEAHDRPVDYLITETQSIHCSEEI